MNDPEIAWPVWGKNWLPAALAGGAAACTANTALMPRANSTNRQRRPVNACAEWLHMWEVFIVVAPVGDSVSLLLQDLRGGGVRGGFASPISSFLVVFAGKAGKHHQKMGYLEGLRPSKPP